jgi:hypothetical protein
MRTTHLNLFLLEESFKNSSTQPEKSHYTSDMIPPTFLRNIAALLRKLYHFSVVMRSSMSNDKVQCVTLIK